MAELVCILRRGSSGRPSDVAAALGLWVSGSHPPLPYPKRQRELTESSGVDIRQLINEFEFGSLGRKRTRRIKHLSEELTGPSGEYRVNGSSQGSDAALDVLEGAPLTAARVPYRGSIGAIRLWDHYLGYRAEDGR